MLEPTLVLLETFADWAEELEGGTKHTRLSEVLITDSNDYRISGGSAELTHLAGWMQSHSEGWARCAPRRSRAHPRRFHCSRFSACSRRQRSLYASSSNVT